jgi:hypothetical protein
MVVIQILQKIRDETGQLCAQLDSGSSRLYEITTAGSIVERTQQMRSFYGVILQQLGQAIELIGACEQRRRE